MNRSSKPTRTPGNPIGEAWLWATRIMAVALMMVLPGILGRWLDDQFGTQWLVLLGFAIGLVAGMLQLLVMTGAFASKASPKDSVRRSESESGAADSGESDSAEQRSRDSFGDEG